MDGRLSHRVLPVLLGLLVAVPGCSRTVTGSPSAAPPAVTAPGAGAPGGDLATVGRASGSATAAASTTPTPTPTPTAGPALEADVLADECLLDAAQFGALLGRAVRPPEQSVVRRDDGSRSSGCYAGAAEGPPTPLAAMNVYRVRNGTPAQFVRAAAGARFLAGAGEAAAVLDTTAGPAMQLARGRFLVTLLVQGRDPPDDAWRAAATAALARLPQ